MTLSQLEILANSIRSKDQIISVDTLIVESLFFNFGTLSENEAKELLWSKRDQIEKDMRKEGYKDNNFICPFCLQYLGWTGQSKLN
jgi:hypothetical protein